MAAGGYPILMVEWHLEAWFPKVQFLVFPLRTLGCCQIQDVWGCFPLKLHGAPAQDVQAFGECCYWHVIGSLMWDLGPLGRGRAWLTAGRSARS